MSSSFLPLPMLSARSRKPLAAGIAAIAALSVPASVIAANTWPVTSCGDSGPNTLRGVIAAATTLSGDTVDMHALSCPSSTISLHTGAITIAQDSLTIMGPGMGNLTVSGKYNGVIEQHRIFRHTGTGTLTLEYFSIEFGYLNNASGGALGGCIYSAGNVVLDGAYVAGCRARTGNGSAGGGAVYAKGGLSLKYSVVTGNEANAVVGAASGGGGNTPGPFNAKYSTVSDNQAVGSTAAFGGGLYLQGNVTIATSTISGNYSSGNTGGIDAVSGTPASRTFQLGNSTISGNSAANLMGGLYVNSGTTKFYNSTIAFNTAAKGRVGTSTPFTFFSPGVALGATSGPMTVTLQSTLMSNNYYATDVEEDLSTAYTSLHAITFTAGKSYSFVRLHQTSSLPSDTISFSCPLLGPLRNNGGLTQTHALMSKSPAIDKGANPKNGNEDQRGLPTDTMPYPYPRVSGSAADIGAYEVNQADEVFSAGFDGCPPVA